MELLQNVFQDIQQFHFLRPLWWYALIPAVLLFIVVFLQKGRGSNWQAAIDPVLLPYLLEDREIKTSRNPLYLILIGWIIAVFALAGPVWKKIPQPVHEREDALIILFDLSLSMYAEDVKPNRLIRARRKLFDLLNKREEGVTGLIVYAGDAHMISPLTDDTQTISAMIPAVTPEIMPLKGSRLAPAIEQSIQLFHDAGVTTGHILIITDEIRDLAKARKAIEPHRINFPLSVLSVGTSEGAPIPQQSFDPKSGYLKDRQGNLVIAKVDLRRLSEFASLSGGRFTSMRLTDEDLDYLLDDNRLMESDTYRQLERDFDIWFEEGPWLVLLLLPLALLAFRRGWVWSLVIFIPLNLLPINQAEASLWDDLWKTRDQQGQEALKEGRIKEAATLFENSEWKASTHYKSENYPAASELFSQQQSADGFYNLGNALAKQGELGNAIKAYDEALTLDPKNEDAVFNKKLLEDLMKQQEKQKQDQSDENQDDENQDSQDSEQQDQESGDQQDKSQQQKKNQQQQGDEPQDGEESEQQEESRQGDEPQQQEEPQQENEQDQSNEEKQQADQEQKKSAESQAAEQEATAEDTEEQQALQQWLKQVPDDPGGLLRQKFKMQQEQRRRQGSRAYEDKDENW